MLHDTNVNDGSVDDTEFPSCTGTFSAMAWSGAGSQQEVPPALAAADAHHAEAQRMLPLTGEVALPS